jgi:hypothetical protein
LGLNDPDPLVKGTDPDQDFSITKQNNKKNIDSYCFVTSYYFLSLKNDVNVPSKSNNKNLGKINFLLPS